MRWIENTPSYSSLSKFIQVHVFSSGKKQSIYGEYSTMMPHRCLMFGSCCPGHRQVSKQKQFDYIKLYKHFTGGSGAFVAGLHSSSMSHAVLILRTSRAPVKLECWTSVLESFMLLQVRGMMRHAEELLSCFGDECMIKNRFASGSHSQATRPKCNRIMSVSGRILWVR